MRTAWAGLAAATVLAGCAAAPGAAPPDFDTVERGVYRAFSNQFLEVPFSNGPISVIASDHGDLRTYRLVPCQGGTRICAGSAHGPAGRFERTPDYTIVRGLYNRVFWLSPGGDGALVGSGHTVALAWD